MSNANALLILPRLRIQNANAISSPMTWGFPAMSAFIGFMHALKRKLGKADIKVMFYGIGVVCHSHDAQATQEGFVRAFHLTRNPLSSGEDKKKISVDGSYISPSFAEEGRIHLEVTLVMTALINKYLTDEQRTELAIYINDIVAGMRIAGGSVIPPLPGQTHRQQPALIRLDDDAEKRRKQFEKLRYRWLPGFALVSRDELLMQRLDEMQQTDPAATELDAWLDLSRLNHECHLNITTNANGEQREEVNWEIRRPPGWLVPIPVGYGALSELHDPGSVANARDATTSFRFVESLYSIGQWISPHRLNRIDDLVWYVENDHDAVVYRLHNDYRPDDTDTPTGDFTTPNMTA